MFIQTDNDGRVVAMSAEGAFCDDCIAVDYVPDMFDAYIYVDGAYRYAPLHDGEDGDLLNRPEQTPDDDRDAMLIDLEYRLTLLELGLTA